MRTTRGESRALQSWPSAAPLTDAKATARCELPLSGAVHSIAVCAVPTALPAAGLKSHLSNSPIAPGSGPLHLTPGVPDTDELFLLTPVVHLPASRHRRLSPCHWPGYFIAIKVSHSQLTSLKAVTE